jgi:hypothetical protein
MNPNDVEVYILTDDEYRELSTLVRDANLNLSDDFAFSVVGTPKPLIILREAIESFPPYVHKAVIAHELAHISGIDDEEEADRWAIENLDDIRSKLFLVDNWFERHGKEYNETDRF